MAFWDRVKGELSKAAHEGWDVVREGAKVAAEKSRKGAKVAVEKSETMAKVGKLRYKAHSLHREAEKLFGELGGIVYDMAKPPFENPLSNDEVMKLVEKIKKVEDDAAAIEKEADEAGKKKEASAPAIAEPAKAEGGEAKDEGEESGPSEEADTPGAPGAKEEPSKD